MRNPDYRVQAQVAGCLAALCEGSAANGTAVMEAVLRQLAWSIMVKLVAQENACQAAMNLFQVFARSDEMLGPLLSKIGDSDARKLTDKFISGLFFPSMDGWATSLDFLGHLAQDVDKGAQLLAGCVEAKPVTTLSDEFYSQEEVFDMLTEICEAQPEASTDSYLAFRTHNWANAGRVLLCMCSKSGLARLLSHSRFKDGLKIAVARNSGGDVGAQLSEALGQAGMIAAMEGMSQGRSKSNNSTRGNKKKNRK
eukprot:CAMPEP_0198219844 /NCGR_PEP_ID=MMETSP1445-20131203/76477_1 /TAXON_ID=36898 /ORGANISM="Pyramimonas sp., Strain CCMP2087" /LENGTH=252 /DNA_ID=CAMNT_0043897407 /DNA_START=19 /DNA_END=777 /DNA_ORIENTATION=+